MRRAPSPVYPMIYFIASCINIIYIDLFILDKCIPMARESTRRSKFVMNKLKTSYSFFNEDVLVSDHDLQANIKRKLLLHKSFEEFITETNNAPHQRIRYFKNITDYKQQRLQILPTLAYPTLNLDTKLGAQRSNNMEYIVYCGDGSNVNHIELKQTYDCLMTFRFPINTNPINVERILGSLTPKEMSELLYNEATFLTKKLKKINPAFEICSIPKTLYHLFNFSCFKKQDEKNSSLNPFSGLSFSSIYESLAFDYSPAKSVYSEYCQKFIQDPRLFDIWFCINYHLIKLIQSMSLTIENLDHDSIIKLFDHVFEDIDLSDTNGYFFDNTRKEYLKSSITLLREIITYEWDNQSSPIHTIYRGGKADEWLYLVPGRFIPSLSYSDGILAGLLRDHDSGMALKYAIKGGRRLYGVEIPKEEYFRKKAYFDTFFIPPLPAIVTLMGRGEYHHPRTRLVQSTRFFRYYWQSRKYEKNASIGLNICGQDDNIQTEQVMKFLGNKSDVSIDYSKQLAEQLEASSVSFKY